MADIEKNNGIRVKGREMGARRKDRDVRVFEIKLDRSKTSKQKLDDLKRLFLEGKWFTNHIISKGITDSTPYRDCRIKKVNIKVKGAFEGRELTLLSSQMKENIIERLQSNVRTLHTLKMSGRKVGKIRYRKVLHSIPLMQYNSITYKRDAEKRRIHIQGMGDFKAAGLEQIPDDSEMATANLIERDGDYFLHIVTYTPKAKEERTQNQKAIGIDLGVRDQITFSNGIQVRYAVPVSERTRRLYKAFSKSKYDKKTEARPKGGIEVLGKIRRGFLCQNNQKMDINNKIAHYITANYQYITCQNDDVRGWEKLLGMKIYQTPIEGFRRAIKGEACAPLKVGRLTRTTGVCMNCDTSQQLDLSDRVFTCPSCNSIFDRDVAAANKIMKIGLSLRNIGEMLAEDSASASSMLGYLKSIPHAKASMAVGARSSKSTDGWRYRSHVR